MNIHYSSEKMDWGTPQDFFDRLNDQYKFYADVACTRENCLCDTSTSFCIDAGRDGLKGNWRAGHSYWMNPPYGREIGKWVKKAYEQSKRGCTVVCLVPSRTDTKWWHDYAMKADEIRLVKGRLTFEGAPASAPFPSAVVIFNPSSRLEPKFTTMEAK